MKNLPVLLLCLSLLALLAALPVPPVSAATGIGGSPNPATFNAVQPGTPVEKTIQVSNFDSSQISAQAKKTGELFPWLSFPDGENFTIAGNGTYALVVRLSVPVGTPSGTYEGKVIVTATPTQQFTGGAGAEIAPGVEISVVANVGGNVNPDLDLPNSDITIIKAQEGSDIEAQIDVTNNGNVALAPTVVVKIYDAQGDVVKTYTPPVVSIPGNTSSKLELAIPSNGLAAGTYKMEITVSLAGTEIGKLEKTFSLSEAGESTSGSGEAGIAVTPGQLSYTGVLPGVGNQKTIKLSNLGTSAVTIKAEVSGLAANWITVRPSNEISIPAKGQTSVTVTVRAPEGTSAGDFQARLVFSVVVTSGTGAGASAQVIPSVEVPISINVAGESTQTDTTLSISDLTVGSSNEGKPIPGSIVIANTGNSAASPRVVIEIYDTTQTNVLKTETRELGEIIPGQRSVVDLTINSDGLGSPQNYWMKVSVYLGDALVSELWGKFDLVPPGTAITQACLGNFKAILVPAFAEIGDTIQVRALFENISQIVLTAKFIGQVEKDGKVYEALETPLVMITPGEHHELTTEFKAKEDGEYVIRGNVFYGLQDTNDCSLERTAFLTVFAMASSDNTFWTSWSGLEKGMFIGLLAMGLIVICGGFMFRRHIMNHRRELLIIERQIKEELGNGGGPKYLE